MKQVGKRLASHETRETFVSNKSADDCAVLLFYPGLIILMMWARASKLDPMLPAVGQKCIVDKSAVVVGVDPEYGNRKLPANDFKPLNHERLLRLDENDLTMIQAKQLFGYEDDTPL